MIRVFAMQRGLWLLPVLFLCGVAGAQALDVVWAPAVPAYVSDDIRISAQYPAEVPMGALLHVQLNVEARQENNGAQVEFRLAGPDGVVVREGTQTVDLARGPNAVAFDLDTTGIAEAPHVAAVSVVYGKHPDTATLDIPVRHVTSTGINATMAAASARIEELDKAANGSDARVSLCREVALQAQADIATQKWQDAVARLDYLQGALGRVAAGMVFAGQAGPAAVAPATQALSLGMRGFQGAAGPAYPIGLALERPALDALDRAQRIGCQWVTVSVGPDDTLAGGVVTDGGIRAFLDRAQSLGILVTVRLRPERIGASQISASPFIEAKGFADITHPDSRALFVRHIAAVLPAIAGHPAVAAVEMLADPYFQFEDEAVRQRFIGRVREMYPDRIDLNRQWHSHLANYDEITLKGEFDYSYQNRTTFQYDWQTFHQMLVGEYLAWAEAEVKRLAPSLPVYITLAGNVFQEGAARHEPNREAAALEFSASSITGAIAPMPDLYALSYPGPFAVATFTRALAPAKPVLLTDFHLGGDAPVAGPAYDFVHAALWELVMSGVDAVALSERSALLGDPTALEALLTARSELASLAPVVRAFQDAPAEVGILFSNASKIYDDGKPHLESAQFAYEGTSFSGYHITYVTEDDIRKGALNGLPVLVIPDTPALADDAFQAIGELVTAGAFVARTGKPIPYNERGQSRHDVVRNTGNTVLVRGMNLPTEYLHAMDALIDRGALPRIPRPINAFGFPLEGVKTRYVELDGQPYLYVVNLRQQPVDVHIAGSMQTGRDLLRQADVQFPRNLAPLQPMLIALDKHSNTMVVTQEAAPEEGRGRKKKARD